MNFRAIMLMGAFVLLLLNSGCKENPVEPAPEPTPTISSTITGKVMQTGSNDPIGGAIIIDLGSKAGVDTADGLGDYSIPLGILASAYDAQLRITAAGYFVKDTIIKVTVGRDTVVNVRLAIEDSNRVVSGSSGPPASIVLAKQTFKTIALRGTGLNESSVLTFKVVDSAGVPVVGTNRCLVKFALSGGPGSGEYLSPASAMTNALTGEVSTTVTSGTQPGVLQVVASTRGDTVKASPIFLTAGGGLPDSAHVSIAATKFNIAGRVFSNLRTSISLFVGDRFGNPVADGTSVTFTSNGGIIMPSATTKDGVATVELKSGGGSPPPGGMVTVTAKTTGDRSYRLSDSIITQTMPILFSGPTQYPTSDTVGFTIPDGGDFYFDVRVSDDYGNPLVESSTITITAKVADSLQQDLELTNATQTLKDRIFSGQTFTVGVHDKGNVKGAGIVTFGIDIKSENGDFKTSNWFTAYVSGGGSQTGTFNVPAKVEVADTSIKSLYLAESGIPWETTKTLTFIVKDAFGNPLNASGKALVHFELQSAPLGVTLNPPQDSTNSSGRASVQISSGNAPGNARVRAWALGESGQVSTTMDIAIAHGLPDSTQVELELSKLNMFNKYNTQVGTINVSLIDRFGYSAAPQDISVSTTGGSVPISVSTVDGKATIRLRGGTPEPSQPTPGFGYVSVSMIANGGNNVTKYVPFLFSYSPIIFYTNTVIVDSTLNILRDSVADGGTVTVNFAVRDKNGNPISSGNKITVEATGPVADQLELSGDINLASLDGLRTNYSFNLKNRQGGSQGVFTVTIKIDGESGTVERKLSGYLLPNVSAQKIALIGDPSRVISVKGTGSNEFTELTFQVTDLANSSIDGSNPVYVDVNVIDVLGGAYVLPNRKVTDGSGKVTGVKLYSGTRYGTVRVVASFVSGGTTISSAQESFSITGPHASKFGIQISKNNLPGLGNSNPAAGTVTVSVADSLGNSLPTGTKVNFRTLSGGGVSSPALTDVNGIAVANIKGGFIPTDPVRGIGYGTIQAWMMGDNGDTLKQNIPFLLSGVPRSIFFTQNGVTPVVPLSTPIADGGSANVYFKIRDVNWRPVTNDYAITVAVEGDSGTIEVKNITPIRDMDNMDDTTQVCSFQLSDKVKGGGASGPISVTITVSNKDLGSYPTTITGTLAPAPGVISTRAAEIRFLTNVPSPVYVKSTGLPGATTLTFALVDSNNHSVTSAKADTVVFSILNGTGQEWLSDTTKLSDANGQVATTLHTGTKSGTFTLQAQVKNLPTIVTHTDIKVIGGFADQNKFTMKWDLTSPDSILNIPGFVKSTSLAKVKITAFDQFSNPVKPTTIQFDETTGGSAIAVTTDENGRVDAELFGGKPYPPLSGSGYVGYLKARTLGTGGIYVRDSLKYLYTSSPRVTIVDTTTTGMTISNGGYANVVFRLEDIYGQPLAGGNKITITAEGQSSGSLKLEGDYPSETPANITTLPAQTYTLKVSDNGDLSGSYVIKIVVSGPSGTVTKTIAGYLLSNISGFASSIELLSISNAITSVRGTGANEASVLIWQVKDSLGNAITSSRVTAVGFIINGGPGAGEFMNPTSVLTNANGQVTTTFNAGTKPGVVQIQASTTIGVKTILSSPVGITIQGGLPDSAHFTLRWGTIGTFLNGPGIITTAGIGSLTALVGDKYGNPVQDGTALYFSSDGGVIQSRATTSNGQVSGITLFGGNPIPAGPPKGYGFVRVQTVNDVGVTVKDSIPFLFTGAPKIIQFTDANGNVAVPLSTPIPDGGASKVYFKVRDENWNPVSSNFDISIKVEGDSGSLSVRDIGTIRNMTSVTDTTQICMFELVDQVSDGGPSGSIRVTVTVAGNNLGSYSTVINGILNAPASKPATKASEIKFVASSTSPVYVQSTGLAGATTLTYALIDSNNNVVTLTNADSVQFSILNGTGQEWLSDAAKYSDGNGQVATTFHSGVRSGTYTIQAQLIDRPTIKATADVTVLGGFPDQSKFTMEWALSSSDTLLNVPGLVKTGTLASINILALDQYSNPAKLSTVQFDETTAGSVAAVQTDATGRASATLSGGKPYPSGGFGYVKARVFNGSSYFRDSLQVLFTGSPLVTTSVDTALLNDGDAKDITFSVADANGRAISGGNIIELSLDGYVKDNIELTTPDAKTTYTLPDNKILPTQYILKVKDKTTGDAVSGNFTIKISVSGVSGNVTKTIVGVLSSSALSVPKSIALKSSTNSVLSVKNSGSAASSSITYQVTDASNSPIGAANPVLVSFKLLDVLGGTTIAPASVYTNELGQAVALLSAGNQYGTVRVQASFTNGTVTDSTIQSFTITGPAISNFVAVLPKFNLPGVGNPIQVGTLTVQISDTVGNAVPAGTIVRFNTTSGGMVQNQAVTSSNGTATVNIIGGSTPNEAALGGLGYGYIRATVLGQNTDTLSKLVPFMFSGQPKTIFYTLDGTTLYTPLSTPITDGGSANVYFKIRDVNWRPVSNDYAITVTVEGDSGSLEVKNITTIRDMADRTDTTQICSFQLVDKIKNGGPSGTISVTVKVSSPYGSYSSVITGALLPVTSGYASSIELASIGNTITSVRGTGATETSKLVWQLKDSLGNPITASRAATVSFTIAGDIGHSEFMNPTSAATNENGQVTSTFNAGTFPGVLQIQASSTVGSRTITSTPVNITVQGGLPDQQHLTLKWGPVDGNVRDTIVNLPGLVTTEKISEVSILAGDAFGNPVQKGIALFFSSSGGVIQARAETDENGRATVSFFGGNPIPSEPSLGYGYVRVRTVGVGGVSVRDSIRYLFSGAPVVTSSIDSVTLNDGDLYDLTYTVADVYGKALAGGNNVNVTVEGLASSSIALEGTTSVTTPNNKITPAQYNLRVKDNAPNGGLSGNFTIKINVSGVSGNYTKTIIGTLRGTTASSPAHIVSTTVSSSLIAAKGTGGQSTSDLTFQVLDAGGRSIDITQRDTVFFTLSDTAGGASLEYPYVMTDENGQVKNKLRAGTVYGNPSITATMNSIVSQPVPVRISGPSWTNFNVTISANNLPGLSQIGTAVGTLNVQLGDTLGNPVLDGTKIEFSTSGGTVTRSVATEGEGKAIANLSGGATPNEPTLGGIGWGYVTAKTQGDSGKILQKRIPFLFSGNPVIATQNLPASDTITIADDGHFDIDYKISDVNRNPLAAGNTIVVSIAGSVANELVLTDYYNFSTNGTTDTNQTNYRVRISDGQPNAGSGGNFKVTMTVNGPNGSNIRQFFGVLRSPSEITPPSPTAKLPAQIAFLAVSSSDIYVSGVGALENSVISYEVRDSLGLPIERTPRAYATFNLQFFPNTYTNTGTSPGLIPNADSTDDNGRLRVAVNSGTQAGIIQVVVRIDLGGGNYIISQPVRITVHAGFPDQRHFTLAPKYYNHPGLDQAFVTDLITVQVADQYSNPVLPGTAIYFNTTHGAIGTGTSKTSSTKGLTDLDGFVTQTLWSSNPFPQGADTLPLTGYGNGWTQVYARTIGADSAMIVDTLDILWTGAPILTFTGGPTTFAVPNGGSDGPWTFTIADRFGHPMSAGTTISVSCGDAVVDGNANIELGDYVTTGSGITDFSVIASDSDPVDGKPANPAILRVTVVHKIYGTRSWVIASGTTD